MARLKIGDIVEVPTGKGLAYVQFTHKHAKYGSLVRALEGFHSTRPNVLDLVNRRTQFVTFLPLGVAVSRHIFEIVGNLPVPEPDQAFPIFRGGLIDPATKTVPVWWLWDGEREWRVGQLNREQWKYPIRGIWNDTLLIERLESGWTSDGKSW
jgi:hypothetical protein